MDERQQQLMAAADALRAWIHIQKAGWNAVPTPLHMAALVALPDAAPPIETDLLPDDGAAATPPAIRLPSVDIAAGLTRVARAIGGAGRRFGPVVARAWRPAAAAVAIVALAGLARSSWPAWSGAMKARLAAAGRQVRAFERPSPPAPAAAPAARVKPAAAAVRRSGRLQIESNPSGAAVVLDGKERGMTPLTLNGVSAGTHTILLTSDAGSVQRVVTVGADTVTQVNEAIFSGWLHVSSSLELQLSEGGHVLRLDDSNQVLLPPGPHELRFENSRVAFVDTRKVDVQPGATTTIEVEPRPSKLTVTATEPAEVLIDGTLVGGTPLTDYAVQVGTREIVVRNAAGAQKKSLVTVTVEPMRMAVEFDSVDSR